MKLPGLLALSFGLAWAADAPSWNGKWQIETRAAGREGKQECSFTQKGSELSGVCKGERGEVELRGKVDGNKANWSFRTDSEGGMVTVEFKGTLESATKMSGVLTAVEFSVDGEFTGTLVQ